MYIIGTDEAGYGPNLGPLVITATLWKMPSFDFSSVILSAKVAGVDIGDSKQLYHSGGSLLKLSKGVLSALASIDILPQTDTKLFNVVGKISQLPFMFVDNEFSLQKLCSSNLKNSEAKPISDSHKIFPNKELQIVRSRIIFPAEYNAMLDEFGSKGELLSNVTLGLVVELIEELGNNLCEQVLVLCDKHGGRNCYVDLLSGYFCDELIGVKEQSRKISVYNLCGIEFRFIAKGESQIPIALSSMFSKYIRELLMQRFNSFWKSHLPNIKPTAGYPEDAKRFIAEIADILSDLKIDKNEIWRLK
ncbi:MAG: hypothetical protein LBJ00_08965 [Planctomycetaceae bacterium]|jgi:ribonuclease HII|nr:hypothetical protein [Planctomycetaceae bacterium]